MTLILPDREFVRLKNELQAQLCYTFIFNYPQSISSFTTSPNTPAQVTYLRLSEVEWLLSRHEGSKNV
jgi:hypothetical protein